MVGSLVVTAGYGIGIVLMSEIWQLVVVGCVVGAGMGLAYGAMPALIVAAVPVSETAAANSLNTLIRTLGTSFSSAVVGVVLTQMTTGFAGRALPSENGFRRVLAIGAGAAALCCALAAFLPRQRPAPSQRAHRPSRPRQQRQPRNAWHTASTRLSCIRLRREDAMPRRRRGCRLHSN
ncbi:MFS transporter [Streptomyces spongiae]|uniref:MFS transporter n=1 Tax=Streptomyces spongiae TaxID=565072 RepID=A0A5N8XC89_9ACTN|nr:MFS transporter [Streptomyces spongiae]